MHQSVMDWGAQMVEKYRLSEYSVVDVGSNSSNGSLRPLFSGSYLGVDLDDGPGVDRFPRDIELGIEERGELVICTEVLEHVLDPARVVANLRAVAPFLLLSCRGYDKRGCWPVHEHPIDVWRFSETGLRYILADASWTIMELSADPEGPGWFIVASHRTARW